MGASGLPMNPGMLEMQQLMAMQMVRGRGHGWEGASFADCAALAPANTAPC